MKSAKPEVLHINTFDIGGGAEEIAMSLALSNDDYLLVKKKISSSTHVVEFTSTLTDKIFLWADKILWKLGVKRKLKQLLFWSDRFNQTWKKLSKTKIYQEADIVHIHNIHGGYFDLKALIEIAREKPIVWTVHDLWLLTGGEAHLFGSDDFVTGKITTKIMDIYPLNKPLFDKRKKYLEMKKRIMSEIKEQIYIITPGNHVLSQFKKAYTIGNNNFIQTIHNGVDCKIFKNQNKRNWNIPRVLFFTSKSKFKNSQIIARELVSFSQEVELHLFGNGLEAPLHINSNIKVIDHGYINRRSDMSELFNTIDVFVFSTLQENFPLITLEAAACGAFVLASKIAALEEQSAMYPMELFDNLIEYDLSDKLKERVKNIEETRELGKKASISVSQSLNRKLMVKKYNELYKSVLNKSKFAT